MSKMEMKSQVYVWHCFDLYGIRQTEKELKPSWKIITSFQISIENKYLSISGASETEDEHISCIHFCVCVHCLECVCENMFMHGCRPEPVCMYVCVCVLEGHLDCLRHLLHHTSGAWCDIWGIYCILLCNITHNLLLKVIMYPLIHF